MLTRLLPFPLQSRPRLGRKTPCFADRGRRADMKQLHEFFLHNVRGIAASCDVVQLPVVSCSSQPFHVFLDLNTYLASCFLDTRSHRATLGPAQDLGTKHGADAVAEPRAI